VIRLLLLLCVVGACTRSMEGADEIYAPVDDTRVLCGLGVDSESITLDDIGAAMERARDEQQVLILFAHEPGKTIGYERVDDILTLADRASLSHVTFPELVDARDRAGLSIGFDDFSIDAWFGLLDILRVHDARVTFFVSNFGELTSEERLMLRARSRWTCDRGAWDGPPQCAAVRRDVRPLEVSRRRDRSDVEVDEGAWLHADHVRVSLWGSDERAGRSPARAVLARSQPQLSRPEPDQLGAMPPLIVVARQGDSCRPAPRVMFPRNVRLERTWACYRWRHACFGTPVQ
jgi:hypothetical protein